MSTNTEDQEPINEEVEPKKKKKANLRRSKNPEDMKYVTSTEDYFLCALTASAGLQQRNEVSRQRDEERLKKQKEREEIKKEKRLERYERSLAKKNKLKEAASSTVEEKKEKVRELYQKRQEEMGGKKKKQRGGRNAHNE